MDIRKVDQKATPGLWNLGNMHTREVNAILRPDRRTTTPVNWLEQDGDMIPEGQDLRQHYHVVVQIASATGEDGNTELGKSRKISTSRKANHGDRQAIYDRYKMRRRSDSYAGTFQSGSTGGKGSIPGKQTTACNSQAPLHKSHRYNIQKCHPPDTTT